MLKGARHIVKVGDFSNVVPAQRQDFEVLQTRHRHDLTDRIRRQRQLLTILKLIDLLIELLNQAWKLGNEGNLSGLLGGHACLLLPSADGFAQANWHF